MEGPALRAEPQPQFVQENPVKPLVVDGSTHYHLVHHFHQLPREGVKVLSKIGNNFRLRLLVVATGECRIHTLHQPGQTRDVFWLEVLTKKLLHSWVVAADQSTRETPQGGSGKLEVESRFLFHLRVVQFRGLFPRDVTRRKVRASHAKDGLRNLPARGDGRRRRRDWGSRRLWGFSQEQCSHEGRKIVLGWKDHRDISAVLLTSSLVFCERSNHTHIIT